MKQVTLITSFPPDAWDVYARGFVADFLNRWPHSHQLLVFYEQRPPEALETPRVKWLNLWKAVPKLSPFLEHLTQPACRGQLTTEGGKTFYSFRHDAHRWVRKGLCYQQAMLQLEGYVVWLDADVHTHAPIPPDFIESLFGDSEAQHVYLGREHIPMYTETGFLAFDAEHPRTKLLAQMLEAFWLTGAFSHLREWHDCEVFDVCRQMLAIPGVNLSADVASIHVFINSVLGRYMDHRKGARKESRSGVEELVVSHAGVAYWEPQHGTA